MKCCIYTRISALFELNMDFCGKCILSQFTCNFCIFRGVWPNDYRLHRGGSRQMITILHRKGGGGSTETPKRDYVIYGWPLIASKFFSFWRTLIKWSWLSPSPAWGDVSNKQKFDGFFSFMQNSQKSISSSSNTLVHSPQW